MTILIYIFNITSGEVVIREGERQRRSRSLSPRVFGTITSHQAADMVESSSDTSLYEGKVFIFKSRRLFVSKSSITPFRGVLILHQNLIDL